MSEIHSLQMSLNFEYGFQSINGSILERSGFKSCDVYRGKLPDEFQDLTWVEEMVCAEYRNSAHVTRIYGSSDPSQPKVFHRNTCAHEMNVISTASILPRTAADVNDMLTVVFVGPAKLDPTSLKPLFTIRKKKVWAFLLWLTAHNRLYIDIPLDRTILDSYPDDDLLPGMELEHRILYLTISYYTSF
jgi:hypothetical protein